MLAVLPCDHKKRTLLKIVVPGVDNVDSVTMRLPRACVFLVVKPSAPCHQKERTSYYVVSITKLY